MNKIVNPEEIETNSSFISKNFRTKLKTLCSKEISNYSIRQKIGMGSYAKVYKAIHNPTGQTVAVKVLNKNKMSSSEIEKTRFEVEIHKRLFHTNIARIYQYFETDEKMYIFMEICQNGELFHYINKNGPLSQKFAAKIFKEILSALKYLKSQRIFHRDIKCENIMFDRNWNAKLVDFGFVTKEEDGSFSNTFCGSPSYTAPQLVKRQKYRSQKIDIWCLGVSLYAMVAGSLPFDGNVLTDTNRNIMEINYKMRGFFSSQVKQVLKRIFTDEDSRATIEQLEQCEFTKKGHQIHPNFINTNTDQITVDPNILQLIQAQFKINGCEIVQSVTKLKLDQNCSLYYLAVQRELLKGRKVKFDIGSSDFEKKKKRSSTLRLVKIISESRRKTSNRLELKKLQIQDIRTKKGSFRIRNANPTIEVQHARLRKRDDSPDSPKRILDLVSAYRQRI